MSILIIAQSAFVLIRKDSPLDRTVLSAIPVVQVCPGGKAGAAPHVTSHRLDRPQPLHLSLPEALALETHAPQIHSWGWSWQKQPTSAPTQGTIHDEASHDQPLHEASLFVPSSDPDDCARKRQRLQTTSMQQSGMSQLSCSREQERGIGSASSHDTMPSLACPESMHAGEQGEFVLTHLACVLGATLNATELQVWNCHRYIRATVFRVSKAAEAE